MTMDEQDEYIEGCLTEFITKFEMKPDAELWLRLCVEEATELLQSEPGSVNELKEACDLVYVITGLYVTTKQLGIDSYREPTRYEDLIVTAAAELLQDLNFRYSEDTIIEAFKRVHESNMSKLDDNGKPIRREDGKIMKGPNYVPPVLDDLVEEITN